MFETLQRIGSGCGIEIQGEDLRVIAAKSRPAGISVLGLETISDFRRRPAAEWGREYAAFLSRCGISHVAAAIALPRREVIVRQIQLPPMAAKERAAAVRYQLDGLHPFADDEIYFAYAPLGPTGGGAKGPTSLAVVIAERAAVDRYADLFEEAGVDVATFTVSAAALYATLRLRPGGVAAPLVIANRAGDELDVYGESAARPLLSAEFNLRGVDPGRVLQLVESDLRLAEGAAASLLLVGEEFSADGPSALESGSLESVAPEQVLPTPLSAPAGFDLRRDLSALAAALEGACPRVGLRANLLPEDRRKSDSRLLWAPTAMLLLLLGLLGVGFLMRPAIQNQAYAAAIEQRLSALDQAVAAAQANRSETGLVRAKIGVLEGLERRTGRDLRIFSELSLLTPNTTWLSNLVIADEAIQLNGESSTAAPLLGILNQARTVQKAAFASSLVKTAEGSERFQIVAERALDGRLGPAEEEPTAAENEAQDKEAAVVETKADVEKEAGPLRPLGKQAREVKP